MARLTASGAFAGAAAWPLRRHATGPATVGPEEGNEPAWADETSTANAAADKRLRERRSTEGC